MLTVTDFVNLNRALRDTRVLSVYLDGANGDPARKSTWRLQLDNELKEWRHRLSDAPHAERARFDACVDALRGLLARYNGSIGAPGWTAFVAPSGVKYAEAIPVPMPNLVAWRDGVYAAPYARALKQHRPVFVALVDARKADVYRYRTGALERIATIEAHVVLDEPVHMGDAPRQGFHTGVHGDTSRDATQRELAEGADRMIRDLVDRLSSVARHEGWIVSGGIPREARHAMHALPRGLAERAMVMDGLDVNATDAEVADAAQHGASALRNAHDLSRIEKIIEVAGANGRGVLGPADVRRALALTQVSELYFTHRYLEEHAVDAEDAVRAALDQRAAIEEVSGTAASTLERRGGIAARLRYVVGESVAQDDDATGAGIEG